MIERDEHYSPLLLEKMRAEGIDVSKLVNTQVVDDTNDVWDKIVARQNREKLAVIFGDEVQIVNGKLHDYMIPYADVKNPEKLIWWIHHLSSKQWFTIQHIRDMIAISGVELIR